MKHPMQPVYLDEKGTIRFQPNKIVEYFLDHGGIDMNALAMREFSQDDRIQFAQLIGYSVGGFHELSYVSDSAAKAASQAAQRINPEAGGCRDHGCEIHCGIAEDNE